MVSRKAKKVMDAFEMMRMKALSNVSLKRPLSDYEYRTFMSLGEYFGLRKKGKKQK